MLRTHLGTALRHIRAHKLYAALNVAGLAIGLACFILIGLLVYE
jgi:putative ABC transport system permease protein